MPRSKRYRKSGVQKVVCSECGRKALEVMPGVCSICWSKSFRPYNTPSTSNPPPVNRRADTL